MPDQQKSSSLENEDQLIKKAAHDDSAFEILYNHYFPQIYGYLFKRCGSHEVAEDLISQTFMKVFCNLDNFKIGSSFRAWIYKIATNNLIDHYRKSGKRKEADIENIQEPADIEENLPENYVEKQENRQLVHKILNSMSKRYQEILQLKFFSELSNNEIAEIMQISPNNAGVIIHRALKNFQKNYEKYEKQLAK